MERTAPDLYVALIRGINVGRAKRVAMADLRAMVEGLGYRNVRTLLNSGNVVFTGSRAAPETIASRIEKALERKIGVSARVIVLSAAELARIVEENSLVGIATNPSRLLVVVFGEVANRKLVEPLLKENWRPDGLALGGRAAYMWCPKAMLESRLPVAVGRVLGDAVTTRNWATIMKLHGLTGGRGIG